MIGIEKHEGYWNELAEYIVSIDPAVRSVEEALLLPGIVAQQYHNEAKKKYQSRDYIGARKLTLEARQLTGIEIDPGAQIGQFVYLDHGFGIVIGETAIVGDYCTIYQGVTLGSIELDQGVRRHPVVKNNALIGAGAKVMGTIIIGENAKVGANAVVLKDVPADTTAVGVPARIIDKSKSITDFDDFMER